MNTCDFIPSPLAQKEFEDYKALTNGKPNNICLHYHYARLIELLHSAEMIKDLLNDPDLMKGELVTKGTKVKKGIGLIEAPRGTLFHHYEINDNDQLTIVNLIVSTTNNNEPMNQSVNSVAHSWMDGKTEITEPMMNAVEVAIRAYDPCLSCATHALGQMPLEISLYDANQNSDRQEEDLIGFMQILIYGYGNPGRQDDGLGIELVSRLEKWAAEKGLFEIEFENNYQLNIEDAAAISGKDLVIFADASREEIDDFCLSEVDGSAEISFTTHAASPGYILQLCKELFQTEPRVLLLHLKGYEWDLKEGLTDRAKENLDKACDYLKKLLVDPQFALESNDTIKLCK